MEQKCLTVTISGTEVASPAHQFLYHPNHPRASSNVQWPGRNDKKHALRLATFEDLGAMDSNIKYDECEVVGVWSFSLTKTSSTGQKICLLD